MSNYLAKFENAIEISATCNVQIHIYKTGTGAQSSRLVHGAVMHCDASVYGASTYRI
jgi:hypothetical protein